MSITSYMIYVLALLAGFIIYLRETKKTKKATPVAKSNSPQYPYTDLISILIHMIDEEYQRRILLMEIKDNTFIYDFEETAIEISKSVMAGISPDLMDQLRRFHTDDYIIKYVGRLATKYVYDHVTDKKNRPGIV